MKYSLEQLHNGIQVLKVPMQDSESVLVQLFVKTGSRHETPKQRGVSHFLEHLLFKGTKKYPNAKTLSTIVEAMGADYNAATGKEYTVYYIKAAAKYLPLILDVLTEMLRHPLFDAVEIEREKGVIFEEMNMYRDTPMRYIEDVLEEHMWPKSDLGEQIIGSEKTVGGLSRADIILYHSDTYNNQNLIIAIAGKFEDKIFNRLVKRYWDNGLHGEISSFSQVTQTVKSPQVKIEPKKTQQAHLALGFYGYPYGHPKTFIVEVLSNVLGGGMSSRLFSEIRERRGLAYYVRANTHHYRDTGLVTIGAGLRLDKIEEALKVANAELIKIKRIKVGSEELKKAKENLKGRLTLALEESEHRLEWYLEQIAFHPEVLTPKEAFKKIDAVTAPDLQNEAKKLFVSKNAKLAIIGPLSGQEKKLEKLINL